MAITSKSKSHITITRVNDLDVSIDIRPEGVPSLVIHTYVGQMSLAQAQRITDVVSEQLGDQMPQQVVNVFLNISTAHSDAVLADAVTEALLGWADAQG